MSRELQTINQQNKLALWAGRIKACRSSGRNVKEWCKENSICEQTYYRWQKKLFEIAKAQQQGACFAEVTPAKATQTHNVAVTVIFFLITPNACERNTIAVLITFRRYTVGPYCHRFQLFTNLSGS